MNTETQANAKKALVYDPVLGSITRSWHPNLKMIGQSAVVFKKNGSSVVFIHGSVYPAARVAWLLYYGVWPQPNEMVMYRNGDKKDLRINNLWLAPKKGTPSYLVIGDAPV